MKLEEHTAALRALGEDPLDGSSTRLRVRRTLEQGHAMRRHAGVIAALAVLLVASASWGFATGRIQRWFGAAEVKRAPTVAVRETAPAAEPAPPPSPVMAPSPRPAAAVVEPVVDPVPARIMAPVSTPVAKPSQPASRRFAKAHELYFHDADYAAALAAFDDYLAREPTGPFVAEARYNRALCLVHLDQLADAKRALQPFADGDVLAGYRQAEASALIEKIDHRLNGAP